MGEFATFSGVFSALGISVGFIVGKRKSSRNLRKQNVISYNATNTMIRNRKACRTAAIPVNLVLPEVNYMKKKNHTLSIRLTNNELDTININSRRLQMTNSEYLRSLIHNAVLAAVDYRQDIVPVICKIYVRLQELGPDEKDITKEVHALCQMLS